MCIRDRGSDNANSIVLEIVYEGRRVLLPGDLESPGLEDLMAEMPRDNDVVMAPHHGSLRSSPATFAKWSTPEFVVISGGRDKSNGKVMEIFEESGSQVFHTAFDGATTVRIESGGELSVEGFCPK